MRTIKITLSDQQYGALFAAYNDHRMGLLDNVGLDPGAKKELALLDRAWDKIEAQWYWVGSQR